MTGVPPIYYVWDERIEANEHTAKGGKSTSHKDVGLGVPRSADAGATYPCAVLHGTALEGGAGNENYIYFQIIL